MNARFGSSVRELLGRLDVAGISYPVISDPVPTPNDNARAVLGICIEEQLLVVNNLHKFDVHFVSQKTYCKRGEWISELDICIVSKGLLNFVECFEVVRDRTLPSDHAPIVITLQPPCPCLDIIEIRSSELGKHTAEVEAETMSSRHSISRRPIRHQNVNYELFVSKVSDIDLQTMYDDDIDETASAITDSRKDETFCSY